jgi:hypothetical protein
MPVAFPQVTWKFCTGPLDLRIQLQDLGPVTPGVRLADHTIGVAVTNAANGNSPVEGIELTLKVLDNTNASTQGLLLSPRPSGQVWGATTKVLTDKHGRATATLDWPVSGGGTIQRLGAECDDAGLCKATLDVRETGDIVIGFFNGVANTEKAALDSLERLRAEYGPQYKDTPLKYDWFYNQTACGESALGKVSCLEDVAEVFEQRSRELGGVFANRWENFRDILAGRHQQDSSFTGRLVGLLGSGGQALLQWVDGTASAILNQLASSFLKLLTLFVNSPTYENQADHLERLTRHADEGSNMVLVAHSQGNLFVNSAVDALKAARPDANAQVVHVAPASPTLRGDYVLADIDLVINGLRLSGINSVPDVNITLPVSKIDPSGHSFEPTYLDKARAAYARTTGMIKASLDAFTQ